MASRCRSLLPRARGFRLKAGQVGTETHELLPPGLTEPGSVRPPFTPASAHTKLQSLAAVHNTSNPAMIAAHYSPRGAWYFAAGPPVRGREEVTRFLRRRYEHMLEWHVRMRLFCNDEYRIAATAHCEWRGASEGTSGWYKTVCNELLTFDDDGLLLEHDTTCNDVAISEEDRVLRDSAAAFGLLAEKHGLLPKSEVPYPEG